MQRDLLTKLIEGPHLLYITGAGVDFQIVQAVLESVPHFVLGPFCWIVRPPRDRAKFAEKLKAALPALPEKSELLLCPISDARIFHGKQGGFGLSAWLKEHGNVA